MKTTDLKKLNPCESGYKFAKSKNSLLEAWNTCERGDWMLWFAQKLDCPLQLLTLAKATCAETVIHLMRDERSRNAIKVAIDFGNGIATREELYAAASASAASYAAAANAYAADADAANAASYAAANAYAADADAANAAANAASYAASYAAAANADADADAAAAKKENQLKTANICREILTDFIKSKL